MGFRLFSPESGIPIDGFVSIPKRGFGGFSLPDRDLPDPLHAVSIPKRGFGGFSL